MTRSTMMAAVGTCLTSTALAVHAMSGGGGRLQVSASASPALGAFAFESTDVKVSEAEGKLVFSTQLDSLSMGLRKSHTKEAFEFGRYPTAKLAVERAKLHTPSAGTSASGNVDADLTLHGVTRKVTVKYTARGEGGAYKVSGSFSFRYQDFNVGKKCRRDSKGDDDALPVCDEAKIKTCKLSSSICHEQICKVGVCVDPDVRITVEDVKVSD